MKYIPVIVINHEFSQEELNEHFEDKQKHLLDKVYKRLTFHPTRFEVEEHHVTVYAGNDIETIICGKRPIDLLRNSIVTPSLEEQYAMPKDIFYFFITGFIKKSTKVKFCRLMDSFLLCEVIKYISN